VNIFAAIFGSKKNTETLVDGAVKGMDALFYTDEEKAEGMAKTRDWFLRYLEASQPQNLARRFIAIVVVGMWAFLVLLAAIAWQWSQDYADYVFSVITDAVLTPFNIIIGFYFLAHLTRQLPRKGKD